VFALLAAILLAGVGLARHVGRTMPQTLVAQR